MSSGKVLFVLSSANKMLDGKTPTGWYLPEAAHPYYVLKKNGYEVVFASPKGGEAPLDPASVEMFKKDETSMRFLNDSEAQDGYKNTKMLSSIAASDYKAIFYVGGHGPVLDLTENAVSIALSEEFWKTGKPVSAICHGPAALVNVKDPSGKHIVSERKVTCFSNVEEEQAKLTHQIPFLVEDKLKELGGKYEKNPEAWGPCVCEDGQLLTGANPASGEELGNSLVKMLVGH